MVTGLAGVRRSWRRSSGRFSSLRLASQVSLAASWSLRRTRAVDRHGEAAFEYAHDLAVDAADMIDIGDHALAETAGDRRHQRRAARRHVDGLAGIFAPVLEHTSR